MIKCEWLEKEVAQVNPDGQVYPCCYLGNPHYRVLLGEKEAMVHRHEYETDEEYENAKRVWDEYENNLEEFNLNNKTASEILESKWFTETLQESWKTFPLWTCKKSCSK